MLLMEPQIEIKEHAEAEGYHQGDQRSTPRLHASSVYFEEKLFNNLTEYTISAKFLEQCRIMKNYK
jgi:hypothetical protein